MEASHNADPREALRPGRDGGAWEPFARPALEPTTQAWPQSWLPPVEDSSPPYRPANPHPDLQPDFELVVRGISSPDSGATRFVLLPAGRPANQTASQSAWQPRSYGYTHGPHLRLAPLCHACQRSLTRKQSREPSVDSSSDGNAVTSAAVHRHDLRLRKPTNARYDGFLASLNLRVGGSIPSRRTYRLVWNTDPSRAAQQLLQTIGEVDTEYQPSTRARLSSGRLPSPAKRGEYLHRTGPDRRQPQQDDQLRLFEVDANYHHGTYVTTGGHHAEARANAHAATFASPRGPSRRLILR